MGELYRSYSKYMRSSHWKRLRKKKLELNSSCEKCGAEKNEVKTRAGEVFYTSNHVHHKNYKNLTDVTLDDLMVLCQRCHNIEDPDKLSDRGKRKYGLLPTAPNKPPNPKLPKLINGKRIERRLQPNW